MSKKAVHVKYCLLGYGYASLIAYHEILKKNNHEDVLILQREGAKQIFTIEHEGFHFSPLPIFPVEESSLYNSDLFDNVPKQKPINVHFSELVNFNNEAFETKEGSLGDFMIKEQGIDKNLCLGAKQWGKEMFINPFSQVQSKIKRHYINPKGNTRMGYVDGKSLFKYAVEKLNPNVFKHLGLESIDVEHKEIQTKNHVVRYEQLISTIPLHYLLELCNLSFDHNTDFTGTSFSFFTYDKGFAENQIIYDCDYNSEVIRIFSITDNLLMAQINGSQHHKVTKEQLRVRAQELAPNIKGLTYVRDLYVPMSYPNELSNTSKTAKSLDALQSNNIIPFGRFGAWGYTDLHELDWTSILK